MRKLLVGMLVSGCLLATPARAVDSGDEAGLAALAAFSNLWYLPAKLVVAGGGLVVGAVASVLVGGDTRTAYAFWVPAAGGTYLLTPDQLAGRRDLDFFGKDYADEPSQAARQSSATNIYDAMYSRP